MLVLSYVGVFLQLQLKSFLFQWITIDINRKSEAVLILFIQYISDVVLAVTSRSDKEFLMIESKAAGGSLSSSSIPPQCHSLRNVVGVEKSNFLNV